MPVRLLSDIKLIFILNLEEADIISAESSELFTEEGKKSLQV